MFRIIAKVNLTGVLLIVLVAILLLSPREITRAQTPTPTPTGGPGQAFGTKPISPVRGVKADIWTAQQPGGFWYIASPVGICVNIPCTVTSGQFETGYVKGLVTTPADQLQQYVTWKDKFGNPGHQYGLGNLSDNSWYNFQSLYSNTAQRWEAWRNGQLVYYVPFTLGFVDGIRVLCGAESSSIGIPLGVECENMQYKLTGSTQWVLYNYTDKQINGNYCVFKPRENGAFGWGPC
jgi:hypothetical protein